MPRHQRSYHSAQLTPLILAVLFWAVLVIAGGASRADALGQFLVRGAAALAIIAVILLRLKFEAGRDRFIIIILAAIVALLCAQLLPLPAALWSRLPGRAILAEIAPLMGESQVARPLAMSADATLNALFSLLVPVAMMILAGCLSTMERANLITAALAAVMISALLGFVQFSGIVIDNPLINETSGASSGVFANRNHQALFLAVGVLLAPCWAFASRHSERKREPVWRIATASGLILWFILMILATGSRAGLLLGGIALVAAPLIVLDDVRRMTASLPRWTVPAAGAAALACVVAVTVLSAIAGRAISFNRVAAMDVGQDMRTRALPAILSMIREYFPVGSGVGSFDPVFRLHEPFSLLHPTYFNHAHNDYLEVVLDAGVAGAAILLAALLWWTLRSIAVWRVSTRGDGGAGRLGSAVILLILLASAVDYPARTPLIMALLVLACAWLTDNQQSKRAYEHQANT